MKVTVIFGSPREESNTKQLLDIVEKRLQDAGFQVEHFNAYDSKIGGCRACLGCQQRPYEICCIINDDMQPILDSVAVCDMIVIAAPVYVWSLPAPVKAVVDRLVYSGCKQYGDNPTGPYLFEGKRLAVITTCGYPIEKGADLLEEEMLRYCRHTKMIYEGMLCERQRNLKEVFMDEAKAARAADFAERIVKGSR